MDSVAGIAMTALLLAGLEESFIEYVLGGLDALKPYLLYLSMLLGVVLAVLFNVNLVAPAMQAAGIQPAQGMVSAASWVGEIMTGLLIGRGSNAVHGFISQYLTAKPVSIK